jgi:glycogen(starch) synthase
LRIALLTREYPPDTSWGGIGSFYADLAAKLSKSGHDVEVFSQGLDCDAEDEELEEAGIRIHRVLPRHYAVGRPRGGDLGGMSARHLGLFALALAQGLSRAFARRHAMEPFDVVESHEHLGVGALLRADVPHVVRYHTAYHVLVERGLEPWPRSRLVRWLEARAMRRATARVAPNDFMDRVTRGHFPGVPPADHIIPLSCRFDCIDRVRVDAKQPVIAFVGRLQSRKQSRIAAEAFAHIAPHAPGWRFEIAGADSEGSHGSEACRTALAPYADRTTFHGPLDARELSDLYTRASLVVIPSSFESFGLVALEAMSFGCVPLVAAGHALEEVVGDAGLIAPVSDAGAFAQRLRELIDDDAQRRMLSQRAIERARQHFDPGQILARNVQLLEALAASSKREHARV